MSLKKPKLSIDTNDEENIQNLVYKRRTSTNNELFDFQVSEISSSVIISLFDGYNVDQNLIEFMITILEINIIAKCDILFIMKSYNNKLIVIRAIVCYIKNILPEKSPPISSISTNLGIINLNNSVYGIKNNNTDLLPNSREIQKINENLIRYFNFKNELNFNIQPKRSYIKRLKHFFCNSKE